MNNRQLKKQLKSEKEKVKRLTRLSEILIASVRFNSIYSGCVSTYRVSVVAREKLNEILGVKNE